MSTRERGHSDRLTVGIAQTAPVWLDRARTLERVERTIEEAAAAGCRLIAFSEALVPGYPFWLEHTGGAQFDAPLQKALFAHYMNEAVSPGDGDLDGVRERAARHEIAVVLGVIERAADRGGHSLYCSLMRIGPDGSMAPAHRKLMPTYEERLVWSIGDGHGLRTGRLGRFTVGALNCWENWMPLPRAALHAQGEDLHVAIWPGAVRNTADITRFMAREGRSYVISACGLLDHEDVSLDLPRREEVLAAIPRHPVDGGSCIAGPDGAWVVEPVPDRTELIVAELDHAFVRRERQNFDPSGHYARPDVTRLIVNRRRQSIADLLDGPADDPESMDLARCDVTSSARDGAGWGPVPMDGVVS